MAQPRLLARVALLGILAGFPARAASISVNSLADRAVAGDGQCTLREAILNADGDSASSPDCAAGNGADTITFTGAAASGTITLAGRLPTVSSPAGLTIDGARAVIISGAGRLGSGVQIFNGSLTLKGLTLADMREGPTGPLRAANAVLTIIDSVVLRLSSGLSGRGGAVFASNNSAVTVLRSTFSGNSASAARAGCRARARAAR